MHLLAGKRTQLRTSHYAIAALAIALINRGARCRLNGLASQKTENTITLKKLEQVIHKPGYATPDWIKAYADLVRTGVVIDVETTGLNRNEDKVIEIGLRRFLFNRENGDTEEADHIYQGLQDPGHPLSEEIQADRPHRRDASGTEY